MSRLFEALVTRDLPSAQLDLRRTLQKNSAADAPWDARFGERDDIPERLIARVSIGFFDLLQDLTKVVALGSL
jgi:hypothetical protein